MKIKNRAIVLLRSLSILLYVGGLIAGSVSAQEVLLASGSATASEGQMTPLFSASGESVDRTKTNSQGTLSGIQFDEVQRTIALRVGTHDRIERLEDLVAVQRDTINDLRADLRSIVDKPLSNGTTFEVWSGILLACVAVLVTVLGVVVALISFIGYRELIDKGTESASLVAAKQTKVEFDSFIANGRLDSVIAESINKIVYRGIAPGSGENETENPDNE